MMKRLALVLFLSAVSMLAADVTGKWSATVETDAGTGSPSFVFKQSGETLTGTYAGMLGEAPLTGTVKGDDIEFSFKAAPQGETVTVKYKGKVTAANQIKGTVDLGGLASGTFTASKQ
jgi:hypothetical protein